MASFKPIVRLQLTQTAQARKIFRISKELRAKMQLAAKFVMETEMPDVRTFELSIVAMSDAELLEINRGSLGHDWLTDVITFELDRTDDALEAEIYISVERARANARTYKQPVDLEIIHLIVHGVLHLGGFGDKSVKHRKQMRVRERWYLAKFQPKVHR